MEISETWQEAISQRPPPSLRFSGHMEKQDGRPASDLLLHVKLLPWNRGMEFHQTKQEASAQHSLRILCFLADRKNKMTTPAPDCLIHFWLLFKNRWTEFNEMQQKTRYQSPLPTLEVYVFWADRKNKMIVPSSDFLRQFRLLIGNPWTKFNVTWRGFSTRNAHMVHIIN